MPAADGDPGVAETIAALERTVRTEAARAELGTPASTELLASLDAVTQLAAAAPRRRRHGRLPVLYVVTLVVSGVALIANAGALGVAQPRADVGPRRRLSPCVVGLCMALLFSLSAPWRGPLVVSGGPIDAVLADLRAGFFE